jgi:hypothetical protein
VRKHGLHHFGLTVLYQANGRLWVNSSFLSYSLEQAVIRVPSLRGTISVEANKTHTIVGVPCGASARLCVAHHLDPSDRDRYENYGMLLRFLLRHVYRGG